VCSPYDYILTSEFPHLVVKNPPKRISQKPHVSTHVFSLFKSALLFVPIDSASTVWIKISMTIWWGNLIPNEQTFLMWAENNKCCTPFSIVSFYVSSRTKQQCGYQDNGRDSCCYSSQILHQLESHPDNVLYRDLGQSHKSKEKVSMLFSKTWNKISISNYIKIIVFLTAFFFW